MANAGIKIEQPMMLRIEKVIDEAKDTKTFLFNHNLGAKPGQFVNVWIPGLDEKPYSISFQKNGKFAITCVSRGPFSIKFNNMKAGDLVGIRGPYGKGFTLKKGNVVLVGGGVGNAPLAFLADELAKIGSNVDFIAGAKTKEWVMYERRFSGKRGSRVRLHTVTYDGSKGICGATADVLDDMLKKKKIDFVYVCCSENRMKDAVDVCERHRKGCEVSMERYMKCGFGICGQCCVDNIGIRICKEGPVLSKETIKKIAEFGKYARDSTGKITERERKVKS